MSKIRWNIAQFFERKWWQNYLKKKDTASYLVWKEAYWNQFLHEIRIDKNKLNEPILDIGCGPAGIFMVLQQKEVFALDPLLDKYEKLDVFNEKSYQNTTFIQSSFEDYKPKNQFQTIFCLNAINHFIDIEKSFKKLADIASRNGTIVLSVDAHNYSFFRRLFALLPLDILHPHQFFLEEYKTFLSQNGFLVKQQKLKKKDFFFSYWILLVEKKN